MCSKSTSRCQRGNWVCYGECDYFPQCRIKKKQTKPPLHYPQKTSTGESSSHCQVNIIGWYPGEYTVEFLEWNVFTQDYYKNQNKWWICIDHPEGKEAYVSDVMLRGHSLRLKSSLLIKFHSSSKVNVLSACGCTCNELIN